MGVRLMNLAPGDSVVAVARNAEAGPETVADADDDDGAVDELAAEDGAVRASSGAEDLAAGDPQDG
jgi:DNA gyrase subunit A